MKVTFVIYADFESVLKQIKETEKINLKIQKLREKPEKTEKDLELETYSKKTQQKNFT